MRVGYRKADTEYYNLKNIGETVRKRRFEMKSGIDLINEIIESRTVSPATLRLLIDEIKIWEKDGKLSLTIGLKVKFNGHIEMYDEAGEMVDNALFIDDYYDPDLQDELQYYDENPGPEEDVDEYDFVEGENFYETGEWILMPKEQTSA